MLKSAASSWAGFDGDKRTPLKTQVGAGGGEMSNSLDFSFLEVSRPMLKLTSVKISQFRQARSRHYDSELFGSHLIFSKDSQIMFLASEP